MAKTTRCTPQVCADVEFDAARWTEVGAPATPDMYPRFATAVRTGRQDQPGLARGSDVQEVLDACLASAAEDRPVRLENAID